MSYILSDIMSKAELVAILSALRLTQTEAAQLLEVSDRTVRRWLEGEEVPGPAHAALRAWRELQSRNLAWRPDSVTIAEDDQEQIALHRHHAMGLADLLTRVDARGGARTPWVVDVAKREAKLGPIEVGFYVLQSGGFSLSTYTRRDRRPDATGDRPLIEDAAACIALQLGKWQKCSAALQAVASYIRKAPRVFANTGARLMSAAEKARRVSRREDIADGLERLAKAALMGEADYQSFEALNDELRRLGTQADNQLVSDVARAFHGVQG